MILVENNINKQMGFCTKFILQLVGLHTDNGKFKLYRNQDLYFFTHSIELQKFYVEEVKNEHFLLHFRNKQYWFIYDTY